ncbi:hypothetical protein HPK10_01990 [Anoxybacillus flavithermus]|uniref:hypothetical protein n=1 Tax=Anoxybacillus flavithermus TaxID=33934 RepID=UPI001867D897|nr:hypothetical protein [Anoxybacillus flavithermus]MBE2941954.1 hypothetical protein [Anoxybacillus flavithermus]MBE2950192.1 hypothetical protein [Anoxybacillus flavithermus]MBE2953011.1 hypothetical protein [Anoxybacillus flavithermus]MBE2958364.1 hypothetical protein [Anoxybacillus flavithermus]
MGIKEQIRSFIDKIFNPPITFLDMAIEKLKAVGKLTAQGLNVGKYLAIFGDMPNAWQLVISSALMSVVILGSLLIFRSVMRLYYSLKEGVKWW